jgi:membrane protein implicated in regulation of membrane protease activity
MHTLLPSVKKKAFSFVTVDLSRPTNSAFAGIGTACEPISQHLPGKIKINGNLWSALNVDNSTIPIGGYIRIVGRRDLVLYVQSAQHA